MNVIVRAAALAATPTPEAAETASTEAGNWQPFAKEGETAQDVIERWRKDCDGLMTLLARSRAAEERGAELLQQAQEHVCSMLCPSHWKTGSQPPHSDLCQSISAALKAAQPV